MPIRPLNMHEYECDACHNTKLGSFPEDVHGIIVSITERKIGEDKLRNSEVYACSPPCLSQAIYNVRMKIDEARAQNQMG